MHLDPSFSFRILSVNITEKDGANISIAPDMGEKSWTTLVIGRNGSGKSQLLSSIAKAFDSLDGNRPIGKQKIAIKYRLGENTCSFNLHGADPIATINNKSVELQDLPRPSSVIAATASAFDKFHLPRRNRRLGPQSSSSNYKYLGLKDEVGRISERAGVFRALEQIFDTSYEEQLHRQRVSDVFTYLGYTPKVQIEYQWTYRWRRLLKNYQNRTTDAVNAYLEGESTMGNRVLRPPIPQYFFEDPKAAQVLASSIDSIKNCDDERKVRLVADYENSSSEEENKFRMAKQLTRAGIIRMMDVNLWRQDSDRAISISEASSGELSMIVTLLGIASSIEDGSLILIDEPEISLHPQWQSEYLGRLEKAFSVFHGCHFIIATHSPTLVAGVNSEETNNVDLEAAPATTNKTLSGHSVDEVLLSTFGVVTKNNLYLRDLLVTALRAAEDGELASPIYDRRMALLQEVRLQLPAGDLTRSLIGDLITIRIELATRVKA